MLKGRNHLEVYYEKESDSRQAGCCEYGNEVSGWIKCGKTLIRNDCTSELSIRLERGYLCKYVWSIHLHDAENWTLPRVDHKYLENFEMCAGEGGEDQLDRSRENQVLQRVK
jgi:hypothetical protein